jgi:hypothetical protein
VGGLYDSMIDTTTGEVTKISGLSTIQRPGIQWIADIFSIEKTPNGTWDIRGVMDSAFNPPLNKVIVVNARNIPCRKLPNQ